MQVSPQPLPRQQQIKTTLRHQKQLLWVPLERDRPGPLGGKLATRYCLAMLGKMKAWGQWLTLRRHQQPASIAVQTDCACLCQSDDQHFPRFVSFFFLKEGLFAPSASFSRVIHTTDVFIRGCLFQRGSCFHPD